MYDRYINMYNLSVCIGKKKKNKLKKKNFIDDLTKLVSLQTLAHVQLRVCLKF